jgi:hypothetical protein
MNRIISSLLLLGLGLGFATSSVNAAGTDSRTLLFDVYLDGKKIGFHRFEIEDAGEGPSVLSEASFDVKFLFVTAFRYRHNTTERWAEGCLEKIEARTDSNGKRLEVNGSRTQGGFVIDNGDQQTALPDCVMTFAYWNPVFLDQPRLLNPQTGEYVDVDVEELGTDTVKIAGQQVVARSVRITAPKVDIRLWYSENAEWLALESVAKGGRIIRYELA